MAEYLLHFMKLFSLTKQQELAPPTLTALPSVITETDRVNLICRPPPSVSASQCHFYTTDGQSWQNSSCVQSVRGSDLLTVNQRPPVQVQVQCFYVNGWGQAGSTSKHSDQTSVTVHVQSMKPEVSLQSDDEGVTITCYSSSSATGSKCNLYFGESTQLYSTVTSKRNEKGLFWQFFFSETDFVSNYHKVQRKVLSCDYTLGNGASSLSPRSEQYDLSAFMRKYFPNQLQMTTAPLDPVKTTAPSDPVKTTAPSDPVKTTAPSDPVKTTAPSEPVKTTDPKNETGDSGTVRPENTIRKWFILFIVCGVILAIVILLLALVCRKRRNANHSQKSSRFKAVEYVNTQNQPIKPSGHMLVADEDQIYNLITSTDSRTMDKGESQNEDDYEEVEAEGTYMPLNKMCDVYATIPENISTV